jgi:tetratricopeptide (TPR) repeat protein
MRASGGLKPALDRDQLQSGSRRAESSADTVDFLSENVSSDRSEKQHYPLRTFRRALINATIRPIAHPCKKVFMARGFAFFRLQWIALALIVPLRSAAASQPAVPIVQLTAQPPRSLDQDNCLGNALLRELQRQAVLMAARDELGLATRDMVLREPFLPLGSPGVTTVLEATRVLKNNTADLWLARLDGALPADVYSLADRRVDDTPSARRASFKIVSDALVNYPDFVTRCEEASRSSYLQALLAENVLGTAAANPIPWAPAWTPPGAPAPVDPAALKRLAHLDIFSQYLAVRLLHQQIRTQGASPQRLTALVRGYANLGALTQDQWSRASKVFFARALLYAERLVVHENHSGQSLFARAYARAFVGLHAAALDDLDTAAKSADAPPGGPPASPPPWAVLLRALCCYDPFPCQYAISTGPFEYRQLAVFLNAIISLDKFPQDRVLEAVDGALTDYPGMFVLAPASPDLGDQVVPRPADQVINELPVLLVDKLRNAGFPASINYAINHVQPGDDSFRQLAAVRDRLCAAASRMPFDSSEPSLGVLADLIEQQEMIAIVHKALTARNNGSVPNDLQKLTSNANTILKAHPWGPFVEALGMDGSNDPAGLTKALTRITDRDPGPWNAGAFNYLYNTPGDAGALVKTLEEKASETADDLVGDYPPSATENQLWHLCRTSPHSATLLEAWMRAMPADRIIQETPLYNATLARVEGEFANRPAIAIAACDWCNDRGDFARALKLMQNVDRIEPSFEVSNRLAKLQWRLGDRARAIAKLLQAIHMAGDTDLTMAYQQAAVYLIGEHRFAEALDCVKLSSETPTARTWQLMTRCYEGMGDLEKADECLRQQDLTDPPSIATHYMWAKRLGRSDVKDIRKKAVGVFANTTNYSSEFCMAMAEDQEQKALAVLRQSRNQIVDSYDLAELAILDRKENDLHGLDETLDAMPVASGNASFGQAFKDLAQARDIRAGMAQFDQWTSRQLDDEDTVDWYSMAGRYLVAAGHAEEGKAYLSRALHQPVHERADFFLAWRAALKLGEDPRQMMASPATRE